MYPCQENRKAPLVFQFGKEGGSCCGGSRLARPSAAWRLPTNLEELLEAQPHIIAILTNPYQQRTSNQNLAHSIGVAKLPRSDQVLPFPPLHQRISFLIALLERGNTSTPWYGDADNGISWLSLTRVRVKIIRTWEVEERGGMRRIKRSDSLSTSHHQKSFRNQRGES